MWLKETSLNPTIIQITQYTLARETILATSAAHLGVIKLERIKTHNAGWCEQPMQN